jgi:hypothetical protein
LTSPEIVEPDLFVLLETTTAITGGTVSGGFELLPGRLVQVPPQVGAEPSFTQPLKLLGADRLICEFSLCHSAPQNSTRPSNED